MSAMEIRVCGRFKIEQKLYEGRLSSIYEGVNVQSETDCAIKCEKKKINDAKYSIVLHQGRILQQIQGGVGVPSLFWFGENGDFNFLVTQLLGASLQDYFDICKHKFTLKTTLMLADKILSSFQFIHFKNIVHRDIKPANFCMGLGKKLHQVHTIDYAYSCFYYNEQAKTHRSDEVNQNNFVGTIKYLSLNVLKGHRNSRRDDLESIGLMLIHFLKGSLPWENAQSLAEVRQMRENMTLEKLCEELPVEILNYMNYVTQLEYAAAPDYNFMKRMFKEKFIRENYQYDHIFDWILIPLRLSDYQLSSRIPLNRVTKKDDLHPMMNNFQGNIEKDIDYWTIPKKNKKQVNENQKEIKSNHVQKVNAKNKENKTTQKKSKQDCIIY